MLPVVLCGHEACLLALREECRLRVFENRVRRRIFGSKRNGVTGEWGKLHNEELNELYSSPNIIWVIKPRRMRWAGHVACVCVCVWGGGEEINIGFWWGNLRERDHLEDPCIDGRVILEWIFKKCDGGH